jgi:predicted lipoprotein with Yx(FWY)xxD motif
MQLVKSTAAALAGPSLFLASSLLKTQPKVMNGLLTDSAGMTLYVFDNDATVPGKSACTGRCPRVAAQPAARALPAP